MQLEIDALKDAPRGRAAVGARGLATRCRSVALSRRAEPVALGRRSQSPAETAERTGHAVYRDR